MGLFGLSAKEAMEQYRQGYREAEKATRELLQQGFEQEKEKLRDIAKHVREQGEQYEQILKNQVEENRLLLQRLELFESRLALIESRLNLQDAPTAALEENPPTSE